MTREGLSGNAESRTAKVVQIQNPATNEHPLRANSVGLSMGNSCDGSTHPTVPYKSIG